MNPVFSISSPGFQKSSPGFFKHESGFFSSPGPGFSRVRVFLESESGSESGPGFEVCPFVAPPRICLRAHKTTKNNKIIINHGPCQTLHRVTFINCDNIRVRTMKVLIREPLRTENLQ